jgi:hypothetical protein
MVLKSLSEQYARRAREFSDSVALLGRHNSVGPEVLKLFKKIKRQRELCGDAEEKLERYIQQEIEDSEAPGVTQRQAEAACLGPQTFST